MAFSALALAASFYLPFFVLLGVVAVQAASTCGEASRSVEKRRARDLAVRANVRKTFPPDEALRAIAQSVMKRQIHPLIVLADGTIIDGECRYRGLMLENPDFELDVIVVDRELTPSEVTEMQLVSGLHSATLTPYDQATACHQWMAQQAAGGGTAKQLAHAIDRDPSYVSKLLSLFKCIPPVQQAAADGKIGPRAWYQISLLPPEEQPGLLALHLSGATAAQTEGARKAKAPAKPSAGRVSKRFKGALPSGAQMQVTHTAEFDLPGFHKWLVDLAEQAAKAIKEGHDLPAFSALLAARAREKTKK